MARSLPLRRMAMRFFSPRTKSRKVSINPRSRSTARTSFSGSATSSCASRRLISSFSAAASIFPCASSSPARAGLSGLK